MNKTKIEWTDYTWNPVTGCKHGCWYCYAKKIAERFQPKAPLGDDSTQPPGGIHEIRYKSQPWRYGFAPTFHPYRLAEPYRVKEPSKIFICSMADLFGEWVPSEWIEAVMKVVRENPQHTFQFLTKNPGRLLEWTFPDNAWVGQTITSLYFEDPIYPGQYARGTAGKEVDMARIDARVKFISFEPLFEIEPRPVFKGVDWIIIGAMTGLGAIPSRREAIASLIEAANKAGIPVFLKHNLGELRAEFDYRQEWPR